MRKRYEWSKAVWLLLQLLLLSVVVLIVLAAAHVVPDCSAVARHCLLSVMSSEELQLLQP